MVVKQRLHQMTSVVVIPTESKRMVHREVLYRIFILILGALAQETCFLRTQTGL